MQHPIYFNPVTGARFAAPNSDIAAWRKDTWVFDPWTGDRRGDFDVRFDPHGKNIRPPRTPGPLEIAMQQVIAPIQGALNGGKASPLDVQVSGDHYKKLKIQPIEYIHANGIPFAEGSVIKYVTRWREKGGIKDLEKAKHFIDLLIELEARK